MHWTAPTTGDPKHCLSCEHHRIPEEGGVECHHPQRPEDRRPVVRWFAGCPQHSTIPKDQP